MFQLFLGSVALSVVHAVIPNHWLPIVAIGRAERWPRGETLSVAAIAGAAHVTSTILIGLAVGLLGYTLADQYELFLHFVAPAILVGLGLIYLILDMRAGHSHPDRAHVDETKVNRRSTSSIIASLCIAMFFSPCIEMEAYYLTAGTRGFSGVVLVSIVYLVVTVGGMVVLVDLGRRGAERFRTHLLEHHERRLTGSILILLGVLTFFWIG